MMQSGVRKRWEPRLQTSPNTADNLHSSQDIKHLSFASETCQFLMLKSMQVDEGRLRSAFSRTRCLDVQVVQTEDVRISDLHPTRALL
jgi:hypothetical protein